jgi:glycosyltransferase involved in cell wall biosynthesis
MKVCFIAPKAYPLFNPQIQSTFGGAEVQLYLLAIELAKDKEYEVSSMVGDYGQALLEEIDGINVYKSLNQKKGVLHQAVSFYKAFGLVNADVYVQRTLTPFSGPIAWYCHWQGKRFIYMVSSDPEVERTHPLYRKFFYRPFIDLLWNKSSQIITQSEYQSEKLAEQSIFAQVLRSSYPILSEATREKTRDHHLWVGRSEELKRPELFMELAKKFSGERFVMVCPQSTATSDVDYRELVEQASLIKNLRFESFIPFNQIDDFYQRAKLFINTSTYEGYPNTFVQAAVARTPILSFSINPDGILEQYHIGIVCHDDYDVFKENFQRLLEDSDHYETLSKNIFQHACDHHAIERNIERFISIISTD